MKTVLVGMVVFSLLLGTHPVLAQQEESEQRVQGWLSGNVAVTTDYTFRGISQTLEEPAIQGGLDIEHPLGLYLGVWGSNVNFGEDLESGARAQMELDLYGGIGRNLLGLLDLDLGFIYYAYPGAASGRSYNFLEFGLGASRSAGPVSTGVSLKYSPDFFGGSGRGVYYGGELGIPISVVTLLGSAGRQLIEDNAAFGTPDYTDWSVGLSLGAAGVELTGKLIGTSLDNATCFGGSQLCQSRVVLSISRGL